MDKAAQIAKELKTLELVVLIKNIPEAELRLQDLKSTNSVVVAEYENFLSRYAVKQQERGRENYTQRLIPL